MRQRQIPAATEMKILAAIDEGATIDYLLSRWRLNDVSAVLLRHKQQVRENGTIDRGQRKPPKKATTDPRAALLRDVLSIADRSPNPAVREAAAEARDRLRRLSEVLAEDAQRRRCDAFLDMQIDALARWHTWCREAARKASSEMQLLKKRRHGREVRARARALQVYEDKVA